MKNSLFKNVLTFVSFGMLLASCGGRNSATFALSTYQAEIYCGETYKITPVFEKTFSYEISDFSYVSLDTSIATVDETGLISTGEKGGSTIITCTYLPSNYSRSLSLKVKDYVKTS